MSFCTRALRAAYVSGFPNGRLYPYIHAALEARGIKVFNSSHIPPNECEVPRFLTDRNVQCVINQAALWEGPVEPILSLNFEKAIKLSEVSQKTGCKFIQISTVTALQRGITREKHPYSYSKMRANESIRQNPHATICHLGPLIGENKSLKSNISFLAGVPHRLPFTIQLDVSEQTIQPTSYDEAAEAIGQLANLSMENFSIPKEINIVGEPVRLDDFTRAINRSAWLEVHIAHPEEFINFAATVNCGINTPEFIRLVMLSQESPTAILPNQEYRSLLSRPLLSSDELAQYASRKASLKQLVAHALSLILRRNGPKTIYEAVRVAHKIRLKINQNH